VELAELPEYKRRTQKIFDQLSSEFQYKLDESGKPLVPSLRIVTSKLATVWKKQTAKKRARQEKAVGCVLANGEVQGEEEEEDEIGHGSDDASEDEDADIEVTTTPVDTKCSKSHTNHPVQSSSTPPFIR